uniref:Alcohol dehydrogenase-like N-terminal domain-containing protein n=1 Tax=Moniliophthora roreri TaxID=221103 RepID=A0A0W0ETW5_MONRR
MSYIIPEPLCRRRNIDQRTLISLPQEAENFWFKVEAVAQNPADWKNLSLVPEGHILGCDFSGTVHEIGSDVDEELRYVGECVSGFVHGDATRNGAFAEFVVALADLFIHLPDEIFFGNGAELALASITACLSLYQTLDLPIPFDASDVAGSARLKAPGLGLA